MSRKYFGTDGIRAKANTSTMTPANILKVALATGNFFRKCRKTAPTIIIGKDTRLSGYMVEPALVSGLTSSGANVILMGPIPTPAVAYLTQSLRADAGIMISASHNPYKDNGIKIFGSDGNKLLDENEKKIEEMMDGDLLSLHVDSSNLGTVRRLNGAAGRYVEKVKQSFPRGKKLDGYKVALDTANGAAYQIGKTVFEELGANVFQIGDKPDGKNINYDCGATDTRALRKLVIAKNADIGFSLDGDADRLIVVNEKGEEINGDQIIALIANRINNKGYLSNGVVSTVMSNMGLEKFLEEKKIPLYRSKVGDRYVVEKMRKENCNIGGEQSGHIVLSDYGTTGDGIIAALQVISSMLEENKLASEICDNFTPYPQILKSIKTSNFDVVNNDLVIKKINDSEKLLKNNGRILIRSSGTEPLIRVMAEGKDASIVEKVVDEIIETIRKVS